MIIDGKSQQPYTWAEIAERTIWQYVLIMGSYHLGCLIALCMYAFDLVPVQIKFYTIVWAYVVGIGTFFGTTAGAHRLWSHRAYKANLPLRIILMIFYSAMGMNPLYYWIRDHRVHHKYSETDADPHNAKRGFLFAHIAWLVMKRHPDCVRRGRETDMTDIQADEVVMFQKKYSGTLRFLFCFVVPTIVPIIFWNETILHAVLTQCFIRYVLIMNCVFAVNSVAHFWGNRPYNRRINPAENILVSILTAGEGSHNYHHTFPWDYKASELPYINFNTTTLFIDAFAKIGWAYDLRQPSQKFIDQVVSHRAHKSELQDKHL